MKEDWYSLPYSLAQLGHPVLMFDHRGMGQSTWEQNTSNTKRARLSCTLEELADDAAYVIQQVEKGQDVHVMGISSKQTHSQKHTPRRMLFMCICI